MFQPIIPSQGLAGWGFLQSTLEIQKESVLSTPQTKQDIEYFTSKYPTVSSASDLVNDRRLLSVALTAFGLSADIDNKAFIQKVLDEGTSSPDALANRLADDRYRKFSMAFGLEIGQINRETRSDFLNRIVNLYENQKFQIAVGEVDDSMRIALHAQRELERMSTNSSSNDVKWLNVLGSPPLRDFFVTGFGLPQSVSQLDIDRQLEILKDKASQKFGSNKIEKFRDSSLVDDMVTSYFSNKQIKGLLSQMSASSVALSLLRSVSPQGY